MKNLSLLSLKFFIKKYGFQIRKSNKHYFFIVTKLLPENKKVIFSLNKFQIFQIFNKYSHDNFLNFFVRFKCSSKNFNNLRKYFFINLLFLYFKRYLFNFKLKSKLFGVRKKKNLRILFNFTRNNLFINFLVNNKTVYKLNKGRFLNLNSPNYNVPLRKRRKLRLPLRLKLKEKSNFKTHLLFLDFLSKKLMLNPLYGFYDINIYNSVNDFVKQKMILKLILTLSNLNSSLNKFNHHQFIVIFAKLISNSVNILELLNTRIFILQHSKFLNSNLSLINFKNIILSIKQLLIKIHNLSLNFHFGKFISFQQINVINSLSFNSVNNNKKIRRI